MANPRELEDKLWNALVDDQVVMLGLEGVEPGHLQPMIAMSQRRHSPLWFFTSSDTDLARTLATPQRGVATFAARDHTVFATLRGTLRIDNDATVIERLWDPAVAPWVEGGRDDPALTLLRFDAARAEVWLNEHRLMSGVRMMFGGDAAGTQDAAGKVDLR